MKTLIIVPHLDDEVLGCAGLIQRRLARNEADINIWVAFGRKYPGELPERAAQLMEDQKLDAIQAVRVLSEWTGMRDWNPFGGPLLEEGEPGRVGYYDLLTPLERQLDAFKPDEIVIPSAHDLNQDHRFLNEVCRIALRAGNRGRCIRIMESFGLDVMLPVEATFAIPMSWGMVDRMVDAMGKYERESRTGAHPRSPENLIAQRRFYGAQFGLEYAEPYRLIREIDQ